MAMFHGPRVGRAAIAGRRSGVAPFAGTWAAVAWIGALLGAASGAAFGAASGATAAATATTPARETATTPAAATPAASASTAEPRVHVVFQQPDRFADVHREFGHRTDWLDELGTYLERRAARFVPPGQDLRITITDVRRAGVVLPSMRRPGEDVRIVSDATPPRVDLMFQLVSAQGAVLKEGRRELSDIAFLDRFPRHRDEPLAHEKTLLDDWLIREFRGRRRAGG